MRFIMVCGFPHSGTTILKCKLGECDGVYEIINESNFLKEHEYQSFLRSGKETFLIKGKPPSIRDLRDLSKSALFNKFQIVFITRNPYYIFTSLCQRFPDGIPNNHEVGACAMEAEKFHECELYKYNNVFTIKYEDLFTDKLEELLGRLGLKRSQPKPMFQPFLCYIPKEKPDSAHNAALRNWQVNQPFENMNKKIDLSSEYITKIGKYPIFKILNYENSCST